LAGAAVLGPNGLSGLAPFDDAGGGALLRLGAGAIPDGGAAGAAAPGVGAKAGLWLDWAGGSFIRSKTVELAVLRPLISVMIRHRAKNSAASTWVAVDRKSPVPRAVMKAPGPPPLMPRAPPSERCSRMTPTNAIQMMMVRTSRMLSSMGLNRLGAPDHRSPENSRAL